MDNVDLTVCRVFEIEPAVFSSRKRTGRLILARFTAIYIRYQNNTSFETLMGIYGRHSSTIRHAISQATFYYTHDKEFKAKYVRCLQLLNANKMPYSPQYARVGARVWTRIDSAGRIFEGNIMTVNAHSFTVESFELPEYKTTHNISTGRIDERFETSADIAYIQPL